MRTDYAVGSGGLARSALSYHGEFIEDTSGPKLQTKHSRTCYIQHAIIPADTT
jgi:hypothetical protein